MYNPIELPVRTCPGIGALHALPWLILSVVLVLAGHALTTLLAAGPLSAGAVVFMQHGLRPAGDSISEIRHDGDGLALQTFNGEWLSAQLYPGSRVGANWLWLRLDGGARQYSLVLSDRPGFRNTDAQALRRFRTRLRLTHTGQHDR